MSRHIEIFTLNWEGIALSINWCPVWFAMADGSVSTAHLEISSDARVPLPVTETGYRSIFLPAEQVEAFGGPVAYVQALLDQEAASDAWQEHLEASRQPSLF